MSKLIDFKEIENGYDFENFVQDLLKAIGWEIQIKSGIGVDGGRDITATRIESLDTGFEFKRVYLIQCKHNAHSKKNVTPSEIHDFCLMPEQHHAQGWLLITSTTVTENIAQRISAANRSFDGKYIFGFWNAKDIEKKLLKDECRDVLKQYFPDSYRRINNILTPTSKELTEIYNKWCEIFNDYANSFYLSTENENDVFSYITLNNIRLSELKEILFSEKLVHIFIQIWDSSLTRGKISASFRLLLQGLHRLNMLELKGLPETAIAEMLSREISSTTYHRNMLRKYWQQFIVYEGKDYQWTLFQITPQNAYIPPDVFFNRNQIIGFQLIVYCKELNAGSSGKIKRLDTNEEFMFTASMQYETVIRIFFETKNNPLPSFEIILDKNSDEINIACVGYAFQSGVDIIGNPAFSWNLLA